MRLALFGTSDGPFSGEAPAALADWADGRLDITEPYAWRRSPEAIAAILASRWGWEAVRGPGPITWTEALLTMQLDAEERIGSEMRRRQRDLRAAEDEAFAALTGMARKDH